MARASLKKAKLGPKDCGSGEPHRKQKQKKGTVLDFWVFTKLYPQGITPKKFLESIHRVQGEVHAKFGGDPSRELAAKPNAKPKQTNKQTEWPEVAISREKNTLGFFARLK